MKKYEECIKSRSAANRGAYNLRPVEFVVNEGLGQNEVYLETQGAKITCTMYPRFFLMHHRKGPYTELAKGKEMIEVNIAQAAGVAPLDEKTLLSLQTKVQNAVKSNVIAQTLEEQNLCVQITYKIIEADCEVMSYLINVGSVALASAGIMQRGIITASSCVI